jgi:hypothetical protein
MLCEIVDNIIRTRRTYPKMPIQLSKLKIKYEKVHKKSRTKNRVNS